MSVGLEGYATAIDQTTDVVCAYASGAKTLQGYPVPHWQKIGAFTVPSAIAARLVVLGCTAANTTLAVRLIAPDMGDSSTVNLITQYESEARSGLFNLLPGVVYIVAACCVGTETAEHFGSVTTVSLGNP